MSTDLRSSNRDGVVRRCGRPFPNRLHGHAPDEKTPQAVRFLRDAVVYCASLGVSIKRLLNDNGAAFRSREFARACQALGIVHKFTLAYRPQTNGKAERFIQSALRE